MMMIDDGVDGDGDNADAADDDCDEDDSIHHHYCHLFEDYDHH